ncbi:MULTISPECIES: Fur family transcriptional regulator [Mesorhizobium]|uniref:Fur family transcriptional regulator n=1 Tax=Mesorhizobium TaxID=68287 RepID=UPI0003D03997|nr:MULTISPECIES: Fur family transcriptional regulator [Mesorhizobium]RUU20748.1 transcriptional repressor [Mesorhizobium sp. M7A.T.Ca.TU.009.01.3.2]RUU59419.1 transcriptional repressor [Mesorhizobium sp. M7A.T.Ca.TU.009.01.1.1]RUU77753.1 transcriptional repressor [Mesorhizobium sp. M7A.T.Ca.TU.009.01.1.2]RUV13444.1 transcriptional repressor [Mesorhizobium sp. M7A.T.Ca.TU.009.01.3.1]RUV50316.1 transcriptional repressor [Mesorhizobium sp. M7A.F.Ca.MR.228.00.0.0]RVB40070.1 transcriptional repres
MKADNDLFERFRSNLKAAGVRMTEQRKVILRLLADAHDHPDANELYSRAHQIDGSISLSTVYRTLRLLEEKGAIQRHAFDEGRARFENADREHHDHLIDLDTGQVIEFRSDKIEKLQAEIASELGFEIVRHKLELYVRKRAK